MIFNSWKKKKAISDKAKSSTKKVSTTVCHTESGASIIKLSALKFPTSAVAPVLVLNPVISKLIPTGKPNELENITASYGSAKIILPLN